MSLASTSSGARRWGSGRPCRAHGGLLRRVVVGVKGLHVRASVQGVQHGSDDACAPLYSARRAHLLDSGRASGLTKGYWTCSGREKPFSGNVGL